VLPGVSEGIPAAAGAGVPAASTGDNDLRVLQAGIYSGQGRSNILSPQVRSIGKERLEKCFVYYERQKTASPRQGGGRPGDADLPMLREAVRVLMDRQPDVRGVPKIRRSRECGGGSIRRRGWKSRQSTVK